MVNSSDSEFEDVEEEQVQAAKATRRKHGISKENFWKVKAHNAKRTQRPAEGAANSRGSRQHMEVDPHDPNQAEAVRAQNAVRNPNQARAGGSKHQGGATVGATALVRHPQDHTITADGFIFSKVYHLILRTIAPRMFTKAFTAGATSIPAHYIMGLYCFDPAQPKQYMSEFEMNMVKNFTQTNQYNVKYKKLWGHASILGPGSPFIANTTATAATNSQITMARMSGRGLDKVVPLEAGEIVMPDLGVDPTSFTLTTDKTAGFRDAEWWGKQVGTLAAAPNVAGGFTVVKSPPADLGYVKYTHIAGIPFETSATATTIKPPMLGKLMDEMDISESPGSLFAFEEHPNFYIDNQQLQKINCTVNQDYNTQVTLPAAVGDTTVALQSGTIATTTLNLPAANSDLGYITSNNVLMVGGKNHIAEHAMDKHYVYPVPPPTTDESLIQECNLYMIYECGCEISIRSDTIHQTGKTAALGSAFANTAYRGYGNHAYGAPLE